MGTTLVLADGCSAGCAPAPRTKLPTVSKTMNRSILALALVSAVLLVSGISTDYQYVVTGLIVIVTVAMPELVIASFAR